MAGYSEIVGRAEVSDALLPDQTINEIIQTAPESSVLLSRARNVRMSSKRAKQPVLNTLPDAYWVNGDTGLKQTTDASWAGTFITAEELAVIVPIPNAVVDDASIDLWAAVKPLLAEAIGKKVDQAGIFGTDKPASWPTAIIPGAIAAGNTVTAGTGSDFGVDVANLAEKISTDGFAVNGFASRPGLTWRLRGLRDTTGQPIFGGPITADGPSTLYGYSLDEVRNGSWNAAAAELLAADWDKFVVGIRQDITYDLFSEGVISDADGKVVLNLMQQDSKAMRVVFRVGFQTANPLTRLNANGATRYPAGVITPAA
jgi:HK97 family phage major capsid protein